VSFLRSAKQAALGAAKAAGAFGLARGSRWRRERLLILCYHGLSADREHEWRPALFMPPELFERRLAALRRSGLRILTLTEGLERLYEGTLDEPAAAITFDDGFQDYYRFAAPALEKHSLPATVYLATWYVDRAGPVFEVFLSYALWLSVGSAARLGSEFGFAQPPALATAEQAERAARAIWEFAEREKLSDDERDALAARLCAVLGVDYDGLRRKRALGSMNTREIAALKDAGTDFEMHTHRHRTPPDERLFRREIADNRESVERATGRTPLHFCYPSGVYDASFLPWLEAEGVRSAATCDPGLASRESNPLLLPRFLDGAHVKRIEFEAWLAGMAPRLRNWVGGTGG